MAKEKASKGDVMSDKCECRARLLQLISGSIGLMNHGEFQQTVLTWWRAAMPELAKDATPCPCDQLRAENAELRQQALSRAAEVLQLRTIVDAAKVLLDDLDESTESDDWSTSELRNAVDDYRESQQERQA